MRELCDRTGAVLVFDEINFHFDHPEALALQTLLTVRMLQHGFLAVAEFYPSLAHTPQHVDQYLAAGRRQPVRSQGGV